MLSPRFLDKDPPEQRVRTMVHESAHLTGIGEIDGESYCTSYDCAGSCGGRNVADSWAHLVNCLSGQAPNPAAAKIQATVTGPPPVARLHVLHSEGPSFGMSHGKGGLEEALTFANIRFLAGFSWSQPPGGRVFFIQNILSTDDTVETCGRRCHFTSGRGVDEEKVLRRRRGAGAGQTAGDKVREPAEVRELRHRQSVLPENRRHANAAGRLGLLRLARHRIPRRHEFEGGYHAALPDVRRLGALGGRPRDTARLGQLGFSHLQDDGQGPDGRDGSAGWTEKADCGTAMLPQKSKSSPRRASVLDPVLHAADLQQQLEASCTP